MKVGDRVGVGPHSESCLELDLSIQLSGKEDHERCGLSSK